METKQEQQPDLRRDTWTDHVLDALPFMFAAFVIVLVILAMMSHPIDVIYSNTVKLL